MICWKKLRLFLCILFLLFSTTIPTISYAQDPEIEINVPTLKVRNGPGLAYAIVDQVKKGDTYRVLDKQNDWYQIETATTKGWVASWYTTSKKSSTQEKVYTVISQVNKLNVRSQASLNAAVLTQMNAGNEASFVQTNGDWTEVVFQGQQGFVASKYITKETQNNNKPTPEKVDNPSFEVKVSALNVRSKADLSAKKVGTVIKGDRFTILDRKTNWVKIQLNSKNTGWVFSFYGTESELPPTSSTKTKIESKTVTVVYNGTNVRKEPSTNSEVVYRASAGETFTVSGNEGGWYKIDDSSFGTAYLANWVVSSEEKSVSEKPVEKRKKGTLNGVTIVIDPGHGGNDHGTTGARGTEEKGITLQTAELLYSKLSQAGANVVLTRESDTYVGLRKRVSIGHQQSADAFISLHYDATDSSSINGFTTYYLNSYQKELAQAVHEQLKTKISLRDRGVQRGNYLVLRENKQKAILIELGFLSNPSEERTLVTEQFREQATIGIYDGIIAFFDQQLATEN
ncbi:SH3 domain-containing protein [Paenisporosarcina cavernae]|uniref:N-acetylmuramoyl-L-alanine amidase n=1 Tax=Paenisporosarcina cavernae TaxID=2320858 RepID=A0A385YSE2_9BACL|nr:SH3 domain-containing protein [Paenisporosarcina cavernae]AYC29719.1 N-acetylmuramoyl-L-alanine amidase [Paenisporosarcina cavernae]